MKGKCPYCGHDMPLEPPSFALSKKKEAVFMEIVSAGREGISIQDLQSKHFDGRKPTTARTCIHNINEEIRPWRIETVGSRVRLVKY